jgi:pimeloyl-ACP methyl ester carboxylesterase
LDAAKRDAKDELSNGSNRWAFSTGEAPCARFPATPETMRRLLVLFALALSLTAIRAAETPATAPAAVERKFTYVIVHGAWGGGWAFKEVERLLRADGHTVYRPTLTGQGEKVHLANPDINLTTHITDIVNVILWEDLHDVVLVGHSYGGMVITGVVDRVPDRIKHVIYLDAAVPNDGESFNDAFGGRTSNVVDGFIPPGRGAASKPIPHDVPHPAKTLTEPIKLQHQDAVKKIPTTYALFVGSGGKPEQAPFYRFYQRAKDRGWTMVTLASDHNAQWSHPQELVALLEKAP